MRFVDRLIDRMLSGTLERRYQVSDDPPMVCMDASLPVTAADVAIMREIANGIKPARKPLDWEQHPSDGGFYSQTDYLIFQYKMGPRVYWRLQGHGLNQLHTDVDELKRTAQDHHDKRHRSADASS